MVNDLLMVRRKLIERITDAVAEMRDPLPTKMLGDIETKSTPQSRPNFGLSYDPFNNWTGRFGYGFHRDTSSHRAEVGDLDTSSLVMAVCNDTGIALAEAEPAVRALDKSGEMQPVPGHPLSNLILNPNPYHIWEDYCMAGAFSYWVDGNWYLQKIRDISGQVVELWYLPHFMVEPRWPGDGLSPEVPTDATTDRFLSHYQYTMPGKAPTLIPAGDMVHLKRGVRLGNPRKGVGAFEPLITEIYGDKKAALFSATILKNLGIVVPLVSPKDKDVTISETDARAIKERWAQGTTGDRAGELMVNPVALDVTKFAFSPQELDLKELQMIPESRVAAVTRYPAAYLQFLVGLKNGTSYASYKEAREQAYESVIMPIQAGISRRITQQLIPEFDKTPGAHFFFDISKVRVLQEDQDNLMKRASTGFLAGILMRSDSRRMLKLDIKPEDDVFFEPRSSGLLKEGEDPNAITGTSTGTPSSKPLKLVPAKGFGSVAEIDEYLGTLEKQMSEFVAPKVETN